MTILARHLIPQTNLSAIMFGCTMCVLFGFLNVTLNRKMGLLTLKEWRTSTREDLKRDVQDVGKLGQVLVLNVTIKIAQNITILNVLEKEDIYGTTES